MNKRFYILSIITIFFTINSSAQFNGGDGDGYGSSSFGSFGDEEPLPIELSNFEAFVNGNSIEIRWQTITELNNDFFIIEKSVDGKIWFVLNKIKGSGNSNILINYSITDNNPYNGISYYRLKQVDYNGCFKYSNKILIDYMAYISEIIIYPNPARDRIIIKSSKHELENINIYNSLGQDVAISTSVILRSNNTIVINIILLPKGIYFIKTKDIIRRFYKY